MQDTIKRTEIILLHYEIISPDSLNDIHYHCQANLHLVIFVFCRKHHFVAQNKKNELHGAEMRILARWICVASVCLLSRSDLQPCLINLL